MNKVLTLTNIYLITGNSNTMQKIQKYIELAYILHVRGNKLSNITYFTVDSRLNCSKNQFCHRTVMYVRFISDLTFCTKICAYIDE